MILGNIGLTKWVQLGIVLVLILFRFSYLEQDTPPYFIGGIAQQDEVYYSTGSLTRYYEDIGQYDESIELIAPTEGLSLYGLHITYLGYKIFGNTYLGLRVPVVFVSGLIILLLGFVTHKTFGSADYLLKFLIILLLISDFGFFTFSRYFTPQIFSLFIISATFAVFVSGIQEKWKYFFLAFLAFCALSVFYIYNSFLLGGVGLFLLFKSISTKKVTPVVYGLYGVLGGVCFYQGLLSLINDDIVSVIEAILNVNSVRPAAEVQSGLSSLIKGVLANFSSIFTTNLLRYNPILLWAVVVGVLSVFSRFVKRKKVEDLELLLLCVLVVMFMQAGLANSYPFKKWIVILPIAFIFLGILTRRLTEGMESKKIIITGSILTLLIYGYSLKVNYSKLYWLHDDLNGYYVNLSWYYVASIFSALVVFLLGIFSLLRRGKDLLIKVGLFSASILFVTISFNQFVINKEHKLKSTLIEYGGVVGDGYLVEGFSHACSFYSNAIPLFYRYDASYSLAEKQQVAAEKNKVYNKYGKNKGYFIDTVRSSEKMEYDVGEKIKVHGRAFQVLKKDEFSSYTMYLFKFTE